LGGKNEMTERPNRKEGMGDDSLKMNTQAVKTGWWEERERAREKKKRRKSGVHIDS